VNLAFAGAGMISLVHAMAAEATESPILAIASRTEAQAADTGGQGTVKDYFALLKPRVMSLVVLTALVGLMLAPGPIHPVIAFASILAIAVGAGASGCLNMWYDADIDAQMGRTAKRASAERMTRAALQLQPATDAYHEAVDLIKLALFAYDNHLKASRDAAHRVMLSRQATMAITPTVLENLKSFILLKYVMKIRLKRPQR
jgi:hypothetical protein